MRLWTSLRIATIGFGLLGLTAAAVAQIHVSAGQGAWNVFDGQIIGSKSPISGDMQHGGDVFVEYDLELGDDLFLRKKLYILGREGPGDDSDQWIYFYDDDNRDNEYLAWKDAGGRFELSESLALRTGVNARIQAVNAPLVLEDEQDGDIRFLADSSNSIGSAFFTWYEHSEATNNRLMQLVDPGNLQIAGSLTEGAFGLAGGFWALGDLTPGELVAIDPGNPHAVRTTSGAYDRRVVGVVSTDPGVVLGGGAFSVEALRRRWGDETAEVYLQERPALEAAVYAEREELRSELLRLSSPARFEEYVLSLEAAGGPQETGAVRPDEDSITPRRERRLSPRELTEQYEHALFKHEQRIEGLALTQFFRERFVPVAVAGRAPVKVSADFGAIAAGDPLTTSPRPGTAMKASASGPVIGTALEGLARGEGEIMVLIQRGWYQSGDTSLVGSLRRELAAKEAELASLRIRQSRLDARLANLEDMLRELRPDVAPVHKAAYLASTD